jgi:hypothetical protein
MLVVKRSKKQSFFKNGLHCVFVKNIYESDGKLIFKLSNDYGNIDLVFKIEQSLLSKLGKLAYMAGGQVGDKFKVSFLLGKAFDVEVKEGKVKKVKFVV